MSRKIFVRPVEGIKVRIPGTSQHLPSEGASVTATSYWLRRISDGDVTKSKPSRGKTKPGKGASKE